MKCFVLFILSLTWTGGYTCTTPLGATSECVSLYECQSLLRVFKQRPLPSELINFLRESQCGFDDYTPRVCCGPLPEIHTTLRPQTTPSPVNSEEDPVNDVDSYVTPRNECGYDSGADRIFGGQITDLDEFPWMALMGYRPHDKSKPITYQCGGVLVNHRYVLTAAHCVVGEIEKVIGKLVTVRLGEYNTQTDTDCFENRCAEPVQDLPVASAYPHPGFSDGNRNRKDDIAIVRLARRARFSDYVRPICLIDNSLRLETDHKVYAAGWGKTEQGRNSAVKLKLIVPIFDKSDCVSKYRTLKADLTDQQICAGGVFAQDACQGDSGGPLMRMTNTGQWETVAVVSFGYGCGRDGWPGVYTSVASYKDWIESTIRSSNV